MKFGLLTYDENDRYFNVGDYIQSLAAKQFLPTVDAFVNREKLAEYDGEEIKMILNGWFTHNYSNWVPSENIEPLFVSFHVNNTAAPFMLDDRGIDYLKKYEPIGCRDQFTANLLTEKNVKAYFSGCLTLTLDSYRVQDSERTDNIYIVDPLYGYTTKEKVFRNSKSFARHILNGKIWRLGKRQRHLKKIIDKELLAKAIYINQEPPAKIFTDLEKFAMAEDLLNKYARAKLVITSRIHCALPCLALGTPVIFINGFETFVDSCRFDGILNLFNRIDVDENTGILSNNFDLVGKITEKSVYTNPDTYEDLANKMKKVCSSFTKN